MDADLADARREPRFARGDELPDALNTVKEGEAGFAKDATENKEAAALAKKVFKDLDTVQLASSKKLPDVAMKGYKAYTEDMPKLLNALD